MLLLPSRRAHTELTPFNKAVTAATNTSSFDVKHEDKMEVDGAQKR